MKIPTPAKSPVRPGGLLFVGHAQNISPRRHNHCGSPAALLLNDQATHPIMHQTLVQSVCQSPTPLFPDQLQDLLGSARS